MQTVPRPAHVSPVAPEAPPRRLPPVIDLPEPLGYRVKKTLLGKPLHSEELQHERLGKPTALAVFASDNLSSSAYATEEILRVLLPYVGLAAFSLVVPVTVALLVVLGFLILSYRQTIKAYPSAGGAYIVTRDNFGLIPAQVAGVALLTDYILTVSVSVAAGSDALASAAPALAPYKLWIAIGFVVIIAFGNLRGVKESGKIFAVPTYFFMVNMALLLGVGTYRWIVGGIVKSATNTAGMVPIGHHSGDGLLMGASLFIVLKAFGSGGAAVTGVEAISNGVPAFREPAWKNARSTLVVMGTALGIMFFGLSALAAHVHAMPYEKGTPTVISQVGKIVYGDGIGHVLYLSLQAGTMLILVLAANTSFADFPRLASFHAGDNFMPRQFMVRGHRLVFSNGIIFLSAAGIVTLLATGGQVSRLIPLYAIGVFTSFTLSQSGMAKHHITHKEEGWKVGLFINAMGALLSLLVLAIVAAVKFTEGAWVIILLVPIMVVGLMRLNKAYETEDVELKEDARHAAEIKVLPRHEVIVLVDNLDAASARAMQYARTLVADDLRAVHFDIDPWKTQQLTESWAQLGLNRFPLDVIECPDRRIPRAALELAAESVADHRTELTVLIPRREYTKLWHRMLHDRSSSSITEALGTLPHCTVSVVPYQLGSPKDGGVVLDPGAQGPAGTDSSTPVGIWPLRSGGQPDIQGLPEPRTRISQIVPRERVHLAGRIKSIRVQPWGTSPSLQAVLADETASITVVFLGRRDIAGVRPGTVLALDGVAGTHHGLAAVLNPEFTILSIPHLPDNPAEHH